MIYFGQRMMIIVDRICQRYECLLGNIYAKLPFKISLKKPSKTSKSSSTIS